MGKDYDTFLNKYIPSADVRAKIIETGHLFSDWDRAAIIWNSSISLSEKHKEIQKIASETSDNVLCKQILKRIEYDRRVLKLFVDNSAGFVYALNSHKFKPEEDIVGYFKYFDLAFEEGRKLGFDFSIEKHQIMDKDTVRIKAHIINSPFIEPDESKQIKEIDFYSAASQVEYDKYGQILSYISYETDKESKIRVETLSNKRFENKFVVFPKAFKDGEKVRYVGKDSDEKEFFGWVNSGLLNHDEFIKKATSENAIEDFIDASLRVDYWDEERLTWDHTHILPIYLEKY